MTSVAQLSQQILDSLTAEVAVLDEQGAIVAVNKAWRQFAAENGGSEESTGVGVNYLEICRRCEDEDSLSGTVVSRGIEQVLEGKQDVFKFEYPCHCENEQRWFLLYVSRLDESDSFVVTAHLPITDRKLTEQRLVVAERLGAIGEAMQGLSHEGRNALQRAQAHIALLRLHVQDNPEALGLIQKIENAQDHLLALYEEVKSYAGPILLQVKPYRLDILAEEEWTIFQPSDEPVQFSLDNQSLNTTCEIDAKLIGRVLREVFKNSVAACNDSPRLELNCFDDVLNGHPAISLVVSDNGCGVPEDDWDKAFQPFYTTKTHGTGLGLALSKRIVGEHHGRINFGPPRLGGASVYITLPQRRSRP